MDAPFIYGDGELSLRARRAIQESETAAAELRQSLEEAHSALERFRRSIQEFQANVSERRFQFYARFRVG
jgi:phage shock protein A